MKKSKILCGLIAVCVVSSPLWGNPTAADRLRGKAAIKAAEKGDKEQAALALSQIIDPKYRGEMESAVVEKLNDKSDPSKKEKTFVKLVRELKNPSARGARVPSKVTDDELKGVVEKRYQGRELGDAERQSLNEALEKPKNAEVKKIFEQLGVASKAQPVQPIPTQSTGPDKSTVPQNTPPTSDQNTQTSVSVSAPTPTSLQGSDVEPGAGAVPPAPVIVPDPKSESRNFLEELKLKTKARRKALKGHNQDPVPTLEDTVKGLEEIAEGLPEKTPTPQVTGKPRNFLEELEERLHKNKSNLEASQIVMDVLAEQVSPKDNERKGMEIVREDDLSEAALDRLYKTITDFDKMGKEAEKDKGLAFHNFVKGNFQYLCEDISSAFSEWYDNDLYNACLNKIFRFNWKKLFQERETGFVTTSIELKTIYYTLWQSFIDNLGDYQKRLKGFLHEYCKEDFGPDGSENGPELDDQKIAKLLGDLFGQLDRLNLSLEGGVNFQSLVGRLSTKLGKERQHEVEMILIYALYQYGEWLRLKKCDDELGKFQKNCELAFNRDNLRSKFIEYFGEEGFKRYLNDFGRFTEELSCMWEICKDIPLQKDVERQATVKKFFEKCEPGKSRDLLARFATTAVQIGKDGSSIVQVVNKEEGDREKELDIDDYARIGVNIFADCRIRWLFVDYVNKYKTSELRDLGQAGAKTGVLNELNRRVGIGEGKGKVGRKPGKLNMKGFQALEGIFGGPKNKSEGLSGESRPVTISDLLERLGYELKDVPGDGNCGLWASLVASGEILSEQRENLMKVYNQLMQADPERGCPTWEEFEPVLDGNPDLKDLGDKMQELRTNSGIGGKSGKWIKTDQLCAIAKALKKDIVLVTDLGSQLIYSFHGSSDGQEESYSWEEFKTATRGDCALVYLSKLKSHFQAIVKEDR